MCETVTFVHLRAHVLTDMRMYWGKRVLEWTKSPAEAHATVVALNDKWSLDGRDPNGIGLCCEFLLFD